MVKIHKVHRIAGELKVPGDKSISHRALMIAALSRGTSEIRGLSTGLDVVSTKGFIEKLGANVKTVGDLLTVSGHVKGPIYPTAVIDAGNSGTLIRIGAGMATGLGGQFVFAGDASLNSRPMGRIFQPLREMGARINTELNGDCAPFRLESEHALPIRYELPVPSAQVKSSILFAGLGTSGITTVVERIPTRRHTEEMLAAAGAQLTISNQTGETEITIQHSTLHALHYDIPGDPSQAAFWIVAALVIPGSEIIVRNVYIGELRSDFLGILKKMGAQIEIEYSSPSSGNIYAQSSELSAIDISGPSLAGLIDEIPILSVAAVFAKGVTRIRNAEELRVKESDRISMMASALRSFGVEVTEFPDGMDIYGSNTLHAGRVDAHLDHRIAMSSAILGCAVPGESEILGFDSVETSYPSFLEDLHKLSSND